MRTGKRRVVVAAMLLLALGYGVAPASLADGAHDHPATTPTPEPDHGPAMTLGGTGRAVAETSATVVIGPRGHVFGFATPQVSMSEGATLKVVNQENMLHTFTSVAVDGNGDPLFDLQIPAKSTRLVPAASDLKPGTYKFFCTIHPNMRGTLTVLGEPTGGNQDALRFEQPLTIPPVLSGDRIVLRAERTLERVLPHGPLTPMWTYNSSYPGPTIVRQAGRHTKVVVVNRMPRAGGALTLHFHGDHHASAHDGQPADFLVPQLGRRTYDFPLTEEGRPERAAFEWYHDHRMDLTSRNVWYGLQGMVIVTSRHDRRLGLPSGEYDVPLTVADRSFDDDNTLKSNFLIGMVNTGPHAPPSDATVGRKVLVNGRFAPYFEVAAHRYRLRLLNASNFSAYNFALSDGQPFVQVGTGNGLLEHPVKRTSILLGPAQRVDVVVDFRGKLGQRMALTSIARDDDSPTGIGTREARLMQFRVVRRAPDTSRVPWNLSAIPPITVPTKVARRWVFELGGDPATGTFWTVNDKMFAPDRVDHWPRLGSTELWELRNDSSITHFIHLHQERWHTVSRNGHRPPPWERLGLEDTWRLDPGETVRVAARFTDYTGKFMVHCHMLDHEDHGLMAQFSVVRRTPSGVARPAAFAPATASHDHAAHHHAAHQAADSTAPVSLASGDGRNTGEESGTSVVQVVGRTGTALTVEAIAVGLLLMVRRRRITGS